MISVIHINISGPVQSGKSAVLQSIRKFLEDRGYCVAIPSREERLNPAEPLELAEAYERPSLGQTVFILSESRQ